MSKKVVSIVVFPGSNCDRDLNIAVQKYMNVNTELVWHDDPNIQNQEMIFMIFGFCSLKFSDRMFQFQGRVGDNHKSSNYRPRSF